MQTHSSIAIRAGVFTDASDLAGFAARTFVETFAADNRPEDLQAHLAASFGIAQQTQELLDADTQTLIAHDGPRFVGFAQIRRKSPPPCVFHEQPIELRRFYVDRSAHGKGVAQALMQAAQGYAREMAGKHLWLSVWERNPRAIAFYQKVGFVDVGSTDFYVGPDRQTDRVMVASLLPASAR
jgi:ribosomal protein S18 acetylase RimI-like enzyme